MKRMFEILERCRAYLVLCLYSTPQSAGSLCWSLQCCIFHKMLLKSLLHWLSNLNLNFRVSMFSVKINQIWDLKTFEPFWSEFSFWRFSKKGFTRFLFFNFTKIAQLSDAFKSLINGEKMLNFLFSICIYLEKQTAKN